MNALIFEGPGNVICREIGKPEPKADEALVRVEASGLCGSDLHAFLGHDGRRKPGTVLGHEAAGRVAGGEAAGRRVALLPALHCRECAQCRAGLSQHCRNRTQLGVHRHGAFAEFVAVPMENLFEIPDTLAFKDAALTEPLAVAIKAVERATRFSSAPPEQSRILVIGGGAIGLLCALVFKAQSWASVAICEKVPARQETCRRAGLELVGAAEVATGMDSFEVVLDAVGIADTRRLAQRAVSAGGIIVHVGLGEAADGIDYRRLTRDEIIVAGAGRPSRTDFDTAIALLASRALGALDWVETRRLDEGPQVFRELAEGKVRAAKVVLIP